METCIDLPAKIRQAFSTVNERISDDIGWYLKSKRPRLWSQIARHPTPRRRPTGPGAFVAFGYRLASTTHGTQQHRGGHADVTAIGSLAALVQHGTVCWCGTQGMFHKKIASSWYCSYVYIKIDDCLYRLISVLYILSKEVWMRNFRVTNF